MKRLLLILPSILLFYPRVFAIPSDSILIDSANKLNNVGIEYSIAGDYTKAKEYFTSSLFLEKSLSRKNFIRMAHSYNNLGMLFMNKWEYDSALILFNNAGKIYSQSKEQVVSLATVYSNIGNIYRFKGDYTMAGRYYKEALEKLGENKPNEESVQRLAETYNRSGLLEMSKKEYKASIALFKKAIDLDNKNIKPTTLHNLYINLAECYINNLQPDSALHFYKKALYLTRSNKSLSKKHEASSLRNLAGYCIETGNYKEALKYLQESEQVMQSMRIDTIFYIELNNLFSKYYEKTGDYKRAIRSYQKSLGILSGKNVERSLSTPASENYSNIISTILLLKNKSTCLINWYAKEKDKQLLMQSLESIMVADQLIDLARKSFLTIESKLLLAENETSIYQSGIFCGYELFQLTKDNFYLNQAFILAEKSKASVLSSVLQETRARSQGIIPENLLLKTEQLDRDIAFFKEKIYEEQYKIHPDTSKLRIWNNYLFNYSQEQERLKQLFEKKYPEYYALKYRHIITSIKDIQKIIDRNTSVIEFVFADSLFYIFHITSNNCTIIQSKKSSSLLTAISGYLDLYNNFNYLAQNKNTYQLYQDLGYELYHTLLGPVDEKSLNDYLIIIPDDILSYIPFEALASRKNTNKIQSYNEIHYLILDHTISYSYSSALLKDSWSGTRRKFHNNLLAVAPSYYPVPNQALLKYRGNTTRNYRDKLQPLPFAIEEAKLISNLTMGEYLTDNQASEEGFVKIAGRYDILHLAMHTIIDDIDPMYSKLVFYSDSYNNEKGLLTTNEIFGLHLKAQMTVLSSCSSGEGEYKNGEGVISLARGFFYAGCPSLIMTLWNVDDESGLVLMRDFYKFLLRGYSKAEAMRMAKINYLKTAPTEKQNPFYWSTYIVIGNPSPIYYSRWVLPLIIITILSLLTYGSLKIIRNRKKKIHLNDPYS